MGRTFLQGAVVLVAGIVALLLNEVLNLGLGSIAFGLAIGAILGFVSDGGPVGRVGAFIVGLIVTMVLFVMSVLLLNTSFAGQVVALVIGLGLITLICALTGGRLPLWAALLGGVLVNGAYQFAFLLNPAGIITELPQYTTQALVPAALGFLAAVFVSDRVLDARSAGSGGDPLDAPPTTPPVAPAAASQSAGAASAPNLNKEV